MPGGSSSRDRILMHRWREVLSLHPAPGSVLVRLAIRGGPSSALEPLRRPRHILHLLVRHRHGDPPQAMMSDGSACCIMESVQVHLTGVALQNRRSISRDDRLTVEEVNEVGRTFRHARIPEYPIRVLVTQVHPCEGLLDRPHAPLCEVVRSEFHAKVSKDRLEDMSGLDDEGLIEPCAMPGGSRVPPQHQLEGIPCHDVMYHSPGDAIEALFGTPTALRRVRYFLLEYERRKLLAIDHLLFR
mmetsp:Transcript_24526/g.59164  ORF Transcript_24526/g.59164 Transcript_24526/m.59164 type:complete len:243 (+) Transcript_24526:1503-2231(+)